MKIELVVAHYNENLNWLRNVPREVNVTVYSKSGVAGVWPDATDLPNIGREAHTYLHHIVSRFESLADYTVFCQGKPFDHVFDFHNTLREWAKNPSEIGAFSWLGHIIDTDDARGQRLFVNWSKNDDHHELDLTAFHRALLGPNGPSHYTFRLGAQFGIARETILARSLDFYRNALEVSVHFPDAAHCFERSWDKVFGVQGIDAQWLAGRQTVYLKPIKRLQD